MKVQNNVWSLPTGGTISEAELVKHQWAFSVADGAAYYRIVKIYRRTKDPICTLRKIEGHPDNPDNYGSFEVVHQLSHLLRVYSLEKLFPPRPLPRLPLKEAK